MSTLSIHLVERSCERKKYEGPRKWFHYSLNLGEQLKPQNPNDISEQIQCGPGILNYIKPVFFEEMTSCSIGMSAEPFNISFPIFDMATASPSENTAYLAS